MTSALVPVTGCPDCSEPLPIELSWTEEPLLRGGGYGAARTTKVLVCPGCGWEMTAEVSEGKPQRRERINVP
jgi:hypothetical protein